MPFFEKLTIPKQLLLTGEDNIFGIEIHAFSDAIQKAYGACLYKHTGYSFKSRVAPFKTFTLPKLELMVPVLCTSAHSSERYYSYWN